MTVEANATVVRSVYLEALGRGRCPVISEHCKLFGLDTRLTGVVNESSGADAIISPNKLEVMY